MENPREIARGCGLSRAGGVRKMVFPAYPLTAFRRRRRRRCTESRRKIAPRRRRNVAPRTTFVRIRLPHAHAPRRRQNTRLRRPNERSPKTCPRRRRDRLVLPVRPLLYPRLEHVWTPPKIDVAAVGLRSAWPQETLADGHRPQQGQTFWALGPTVLQRFVYTHTHIHTTQ